MPVTLDIEENGRLFVVKMFDPAKMEDLIATYPQVIEHLNNGAQSKVYTLVDLTGLKSVPPFALKGRNNPYIMHSRSGEVAIVGAHQYARMIVETAFKVVGFKKFLFETDIAKARSFLMAKIGQDTKVLSSTKGD